MKNITTNVFTVFCLVLLGSSACQKNEQENTIPSASGQVQSEIQNLSKKYNLDIETNPVEVTDTKQGESNRNLSNPSSNIVIKTPEELEAVFKMADKLKRRGAELDQNSESMLNALKAAVGDKNKEAVLKKYGAKQDEILKKYPDLK